MLLFVSAFVALIAGQGTDGWEMPSWLSLHAAYEWRLPRILAAAAAGILLALAGTIIQRLSGNPMASPELLGISSSTPK
jgi:iron complex transport system permease protein